MTLISLIVLATTNPSIAKEQAPEWTVGCYLTYSHPVTNPMTGEIGYEMRTVYLGNVPEGGFGVGLCEIKSRAYLEMRDPN